MHEDVPDHLLFLDGDAKARAVARGRPEHRARDALVVQESKRFRLPLDSRDDDAHSRARTPHSQILRYLSTADRETDSDLHWGFLTNGAVWRLYDYRARPRATAYYEADLGEILKAGDDDRLRAFRLLLRRESFVPAPGALSTFLDVALSEGRRYEQKVAQDLSTVVFKTVFPRLVTALLARLRDNSQHVRDAALVFLYRLLFILYAEDRGLLPVAERGYRDYNLRRIRDEVAERMDGFGVFSATASVYWDRLANLFRLIDKGDQSIGLPPYNGGLFAPDETPLLDRVRLPDDVVAPIIYALSHTKTAENGQIVHRFVNYRDMSVQQLGSIYERLLERQLTWNDLGEVAIRPNPYARKDSGSFYTPQELVDLIVERTLKPLAEERLRAFEQKSKALAGDTRPKAAREEELRTLDPAVAVLNLKVLDPAMGSGHFLVTAVDFLSDYIADLVEYVPAVPDWLDGEYASPLVERVEAIRQDILKRAKVSRWTIEESQLTDQAIIRRMVLKRCIYGVDKNLMTVELAKVSLWLHSFTVGAPLSFLDHHLRCGDSLLGMRVEQGTRELSKLAGLSAQSAIAGAEMATEGMQRIEATPDSDIAEVRESSALFNQVEDLTADLRGVLDFLQGLRWQTAGMDKKTRAAFQSSLAEALEQRPADAYKLLAQGPQDDEGPNAGFQDKWRSAKSIAHREGFLHWEVAFPGVWHGWQNVRPQGGFDAVIGNPPWDRIKLQEVEWFASRDEDVSRTTTAAQRRAAIQRLRNQQSPLVNDFDDAKRQADELSTMLRVSGHYPLLFSGDVNLYSLFVERAMNLVKPDGFVGLLTPSGIYADRSAARFFKTVSTSGRLGGLFDFENRRRTIGRPDFFPDVDSRFKFCAIIFGGQERMFLETECAFFLQGTETVRDPDRCFPLTPEDFTRVNPNTATAPVFRTRRDAEITRHIYENHPVLADHSKGQRGRAWPARYIRMLDMTNDSGLFRTAERLKADGFYPVEGNRWKKGDELYLPLYQGRMIWHFDHRANSVEVNPENLHNPYLSVEVTEEQHANPHFLPRTEYWVPASEVEDAAPDNSRYFLGFRDIARPTDARTVIAAVVPLAGYGNTVPLLVEDDERTNRSPFEAIDAACLAANLNSFCIDYVARQKVQGTHLNWYIVEQLPVIAKEGYDRRFGTKTARDIVRYHVLRLSYTAHDMAPFARDLGYDGPPYTWNAEERRHLRARLDALYFHLYGISREDASYIMDTFPIVRRHDEKDFKKYRTKEMVLAYMNALAAGDTDTDVAV